MKNHLNNIVVAIDKEKIETSHYDIHKLNLIKVNIKKIIKEIIDNNDYDSILDLVDYTSNLIYDLNDKYKFTDFTDYLSTEFYAFMYILEKNIKERSL